MSKRGKNKEEFNIEAFLAESDYDASMYEIEKIKRKERREQKKKKDKARRNKFVEDY